MSTSTSSCTSLSGRLPVQVAAAASATAASEVTKRTRMVVVAALLDHLPALSASRSVSAATIVRRCSTRASLHGREVDGVRRR